MDREPVADSGKQVAREQLAAQGISVRIGVNKRLPSEVQLIDSNGATGTAYVRTANGGGWQFNARKFLNIAIDEEAGTQQIESVIKLKRPDALFILVWLGQKKQRGNRHFILTHAELQEKIRASYQWWLDNHAGGRPDKPASTHVALVTDVLSEFEDRWTAIKLSLGASDSRSPSLEC